MENKLYEQDDTNVIKFLQDICEKVEKKNDNLEFKNTLKQNVENITFFLKNNKNIYIPLLGDSRVGKSTILNDSIGIKDFLNVKDKEGTRKAVVIKYRDDDNIYLRELKLVQKTDFKNSNYYFEPAIKVIATGSKDNLKEITEQLENLNFGKKTEDIFYEIECKIKIIDEMNLEPEIKNKINFIDFPGSSTDSSDILKKIFPMCSLFLFIVLNNIKTENNKKTINELYEIIKESKKECSDELMKMFLFIINSDIDQAIDDEQLNNEVKSIEDIIPNSKVSKDNATFLKGLLYSNYLENINFFTDIKNTINQEIKLHQEKKKSENDEDDIGEFVSNFYKNVQKKIKEIKIEYDPEKIDKIDDNIKNVVDEGIEKAKNIFSTEDFKEEQIEAICKMISFARLNIASFDNNLNSNIGQFKLTFKIRLYDSLKINENFFKKNVRDGVDKYDSFFENSDCKENKHRKCRTKNKRTDLIY